MPNGLQTALLYALAMLPLTSTAVVKVFQYYWAKDHYPVLLQYIKLMLPFFHYNNNTWRLKATSDPITCNQIFVSDFKMHINYEAWQKCQIWLAHTSTRVFKSAYRQNKLGTDEQFRNINIVKNMSKLVYK